MKVYQQTTEWNYELLLSLSTSYLLYHNTDLFIKFTNFTNPLLTVIDLECRHVQIFLNMTTSYQFAQRSLHSNELAKFSQRGNDSKQVSIVR